MFCPAFIGVLTRFLMVSKPVFNGALTRFNNVLTCL